MTEKIIAKCELLAIHNGFCPLCGHHAGRVWESGKFIGIYCPFCNKNFKNE